MNYYYIEDGDIIKGPIKLPTVLGNSSGFDKQTPEELRELGWLPEELVGYSGTISDTQIVDKPLVDIQLDKVVVRTIIREKTQIEIDIEIKMKEVIEAQEYDNPQQRFNFIIYNKIHTDTPLNFLEFITYWKNNVA